jgi:protein-S-isoprenylcysteine O-methyltransferase Ste14
MTPWLFAVALAAQLVLVGGAVLALVRPGLRVWPPPGRDSWQFRFVWIGFALAAGAMIALGVADWNGLGLPRLPRLAVGGLLVVAGLSVAFRAIARLSWHQSLGLQGELRTGGLYRFSRNPQYVGDMAATAGWAVLTGSGFVAGVAAAAVAWYALLPLLEEPWLERRYGDAYRRYRARVPRFL